MLGFVKNKYMYCSLPKHVTMGDIIYIYNWPTLYVPLASFIILKKAADTLCPSLSACVIKKNSQFVLHLYHEIISI